MTRKDRNKQTKNKILSMMAWGKKFKLMDPFLDSRAPSTAQHNEWKKKSQDLLDEIFGNFSAEKRV